jgi:predicted phosphoribosyltransferase
MTPPFRNRTDAGERLAARLAGMVRGADNLVLALPRGGVPVAAPVARRLHAQLDVLVVRKLGVPGHEEFAMGAVGPGGVCLVNHETIGHLGLKPAAVQAVVDREARERERRERAYRGDRPPPGVAGRTVVLVDDGIATGASMRAAIAAVRALRPARIVVAAPVVARDTRDELARLADACVTLLAPDDFGAVGAYFEDFAQVSDAEVGALLAAAAEPRPTS